MSEHIYQKPYDDGFADGQDAAKARIAELEAQLAQLREAVSNMNPNNPFSVTEVQIMVEGK